MIYGCKIEGKSKELVRFLKEESYLILEEILHSCFFLGASVYDKGGRGNRMHMTTETPFAPQ